MSDCIHPSECTKRQLCGDFRLYPETLPDSYYWWVWCSACQESWKESFEDQDGN